MDREKMEEDKARAIGAYQTLNIPPTDDVGVVESAYQVMIMRCHPDDVQEETSKAEAAEITQQVDNARDFLKSNLVAAYEAAKPATPHRSEPTAVPPRSTQRTTASTALDHPVFKHDGGLSNLDFWAAPLPPMERPRMPAVVGDLEVTTKELKEIEYKIISLPVNVVCEDCNATGAKSGEGGLVPCKTCCDKSGEGITSPGYVWKSRPSPLHQELFGEEGWTICDDCHGSGKIVRRPCSLCKGEKMRVDNYRYWVPLHPDMKSGELYIFEGEGNESLSTRYRTGDVKVRIIVDGVKEGEYVNSDDEWVEFDGSKEGCQPS
ncbi:hypothetical protein DM02DRAFT_685877 [Periconia macrospinosa]|uniref:CR-type domain-containing protein n=1 Tax=Periconia macrospinosa TaxID=97972 RepID=A0A2V1DGE9_9PLEO|nr:hypothetical protein DM02DRAFT_685877 [Periconia macrospinosa]